MVQEAEEFAEEDKAIKERVDARNDLESLVYSTKSKLEDKYKDSLSEEDMEAANEAVQEALSWLDDNQDAEKEDYQEKKRELEDIVQPILARGDEAGGGGGGEGGEGDSAEEDLDDHDEL